MKGSPNRKALIHDVLDGKRSERLPKALFGSGLWAYKLTGLRIEGIVRDTDRAIDALSSFYSNLDTDILFLGSGLNSFPAEAIGGELKFRGEQAPMLVKPIIHGLDDIRRIGEIDLFRSQYTTSLIRVIGGVRKNLPERFLCATAWGPFTWALILCDWEFLKEKVVTDKPFIKKITEFGSRLSSAFFDTLIDRGLIDGVSVPEGSVTLIPDRDYADLVLPFQRDFFSYLKKRGVRPFLHMCGEIRSQLPLYLETGAECISVDNHVTISEAYELYRASSVTAGNVDVINVIEKGDEDLIRRATAECIGQVTDPFSRYIVMPSCDVPIGTPLRNAEVFLSCADRRQAFPSLL